MARKVRANLPLEKAVLISFFLENLLFGISALLCLITLWFLVYGRTTTYLNKKLVATSSLMMLFSTLHVSVDLFRVLDGFIGNEIHHEGPTKYFSRISEWSFLFKTAIFVAQTVLADTFATYRSYVLWNRTWAAAIPSTFVIATLATGIGVIYNCAIIDSDKDVFSSTLIGWITGYFMLTLATNLCCTILIASRIFFATKNYAQFSGQRTLIPVAVIVIESGTIYSLSCIAIVVLYLLDSYAQYLAIDSLLPIISITFNLIILRIALGLSQDSTSLTTMKNASSAFVDTSLAQSQDFQRSHIVMDQLTITNRGDMESGNDR